MRQERQQGKQQDEQGVDDSFRNDRADTHGEVGSLVALQDTTTQDFANSRHDETAGVAEENGMGASREPRLLTGWSQNLAPSHGTKHLRQNTKRHAKEHPRPRHLVLQSVRQFFPTYAAIHPPKYADSQRQRQTYLYKLSYSLHVLNELFFLSLQCKCTKN